MEGARGSGAASNVYQFGQVQTGQNYRIKQQETSSGGHSWQIGTDKSINNKAAGQQAVNQMLKSLKKDFERVGAETFIKEAGTPTMIGLEGFISDIIRKENEKQGVAL